ncbi:hypothetical protein MKW92_032913, partial [Papaver armeniacum]
MIIDLGFFVQSIMRFGFLISEFFSDAYGNGVDKLTEKLQGVGIDGVVLTNSK